MPIRAIWILSPNAATGECKVVYSRTFTTVELRAKKVLGDEYKPVPSARQLLSKNIYRQLNPEKSWTTEKFNGARERFKPAITPVVQLDASGVILWPVAIAEHYGCMILCLPLVEDPNLTSQNNSPLLSIPAVTTAISVISSIQKFVGPLPADVNAMHPTLVNLNLFLSEGMPFGRPKELEVAVIRSLFQLKEASVSPNVKQQSQRPANVKGRPNGSLALTEYVRSVQMYKDNSGQDFLQVYGTIDWKGLLDNPNTEVTTLLTLQSNKSVSPTLNFVATHPCVNQIETTPSAAVAKKIRFSPILENFNLCYYAVKTKGTLPVYGSYKLRCEPAHVDLLLQLKLDFSVKNSFKTCEVKIPLSRPGIVTKIDLKPSWGNVSVKPDGKLISWQIGQNFPSKTMEVSLSGVVYYSNSPIINSEDMFQCVSGSYANLYFRVEDYTFSGVGIDSVQFSPPVKCKVNCTKSCVAFEYQIWNSCGNPPVLPTWEED